MPWLVQSVEVEVLVLVQDLIDVCTQVGNVRARRLWPCLEEIVEIGNTKMLPAKRVNKLVTSIQFIAGLLHCMRV